MNLFKKKSRPATFPQYFRHKSGVHHRWINEKTFDKAYIENGELHIVQTRFEFNQLDDLINSAPGWKRITETAWNEFAARIALRDIDLYGHRELHYAFTCGDVNFYTFSDNINDVSDLPVGRYLEANAAVMEMQTVANREYLEKFTAFIDECTGGQAPHVGKIHTANNDLKHVMAIGFSAPAYLRLFTVMYVTEGEDIGKWDPAHADWKIRHCREHGGDGFFLGLPFKDSIPHNLSSEADFQANMMEVNKKIKGALLRLEAMKSKGI